MLPDAGRQRREPRPHRSACVAGGDLAGPWRSRSRGSRRARRSLRDERGKSTAKALRAFRSNGHEATRISASVARSGIEVTIAGAELLGECGVRGGPGRVRRVVRDRLAVAGRLGESNVARDDGIEHAVTQMPPDFTRDIGRELRPSVVHRQDHALEGEVRVQVITNEFEGGKQLRQSFQGVVLTLERDQNRIGGGQGIHGQEPE